MLKKTLVVAGLVASLMASSAWAGSAYMCVQVHDSYIYNSCPFTIEVAWCGGIGCSLSNGASWTLQANGQIPHNIPPGSPIKHDACTDANSIRSFSPFSCR